MFEKCDWTKYLINNPKRNYQSNNTCTATFVFDFFFSSCNYNIYILVVTKLFKTKCLAIHTTIAKLCIDYNNTRRIELMSRAHLRLSNLREPSWKHNFQDLIKSY